MAIFSLDAGLLARATMRTLVASTLAIAGLASVPIVDPCRTATWADPYLAQQRSGERRFGQDARSGRNGEAGRSGQDGESQTINAQGAPVNLDLSGGDGERGENGDSASWSHCRRQPRNSLHDLQAASGGNGGQGGSGGNGGDGGDLLIYYTDPDHLRQVLVDASGGRGGRGGRGGNGTDGCTCDVDDWRIQTCENGICRTDEYECDDGSDGRDGQDGQGGDRGTTGQLMLVNQVEALPTETPSLRMPLSQLSNQTVDLSRNLWETRSGARGLLASGSTIQDDYYAYLGHLERQFSLDWQAPQAANRFTDDINLSLKENGEVEILFPETYWLLGDMMEQNALTTYRVDGIIPIADVTRLAMGRVTGRSRSFEINVVDQGQLSHELETEFELRYSTTRDDRRRRRYTVAYEGPVPADLIGRDHNRFTLALGQLPISSQLMSGGTEARVELVITRRYGGNTQQQTVSWSGRI